MKAYLILPLLFISFLSYSQTDSSRVAKRANRIFIPKYERTKGYVGWVEGGMLVVPSVGTKYGAFYPAPSLRIFNGARINRYVTLGVETGLDMTVQIPVNAMVRVNLTQKKITPFFDFSAGYTWNWMTSYNSHGFNYMAAAGFKVWGNKGRAAFTFKAGYTGIYIKPYSTTGYSYLGPPLQPGYFSGFFASAGVEF